MLKRFHQIVTEVDEIKGFVQGLPTYTADTENFQRRKAFAISPEMEFFKAEQVVRKQNLICLVKSQK